MTKFIGNKAIDFMPVFDLICCVTNDLNYDQRMQRICQSLNNEKWNILLVGRQKKNSSKLTSQKSQQQRLHCFFQKGFLFYAEYNIRLFIFLLFHSSKAICAVDLDTLPACFLSAKITRRQLVFDAHEWYEGTPELESRPFVKSFWKAIAKWILPSVLVNYTVSNSVKNAYEEKYNSHYSLIRNFPLKKQPVAVQKKKGLIIYQGVLNKGRGLETLMNVVGNRNDCELWLVGEGDLSNDLRKHVNDNRYKNIYFKGFVSPEKLHELTCHAYIGINLLESDSLNYYYSLANKFLDYVQAEVPSICMNFPEYAKLNQVFEVSSLVNKIDQVEISNALDRLLNEDKYYDLLKSNCKKASQIWTWEKEESKLIEIYRKILN